MAQDSLPAPSDQLMLWNSPVPPPRPRPESPEHVPHAAGSPTSREAVEQLTATGRPARLRDAVLSHIVAAGSRGLTRQECAAAMGRHPSDLCAAYQQLARAGRIVSAGTRPNPVTGMQFGPRPKCNGSARPGGLSIRFLLLRRHEFGYWNPLSNHRTKNGAIAAAGRHARQLTHATPPPKTRPSARRITSSTYASKPEAR